MKNNYYKPGNMERDGSIRSRSASNGVKIAFFALLLLLLGANNAEAGVISRAPNNLGLVGYWSFNDATSTNTGYPNRAADFSGNGNTGILTNGPTWSNGRLGKALSFDGSDDYVDMGNVLNLAGSSLTMSAWINPTVLPSAATFDVFIGRGQITGGLYTDYSLDIVGTSKVIEFAFNNAGAGWKTLLSTATISANKWQMVTATFSANNTTVSLYINGVFDSSSNLGEGIPSNASAVFQIGSNLGGGNRVYHNGLIDEVRVYNRALSAAEVKALYQSGAAKFTNPNNLGLVGYWSFNDATSTNTGYPNRAADFSGNGNTGVLTNGPTWSNGRLGKALSFDGSNDYVDAGDIAAAESTSYLTVSAWANPSSLCGFSMPVSKGESATSRWFMSSDTAGSRNGVDSIDTGVGDGSNSFGYTSAGLLKVGQWGHWVMVFDGTQADNASRLKFYFNGVNQTLTFSGTIPSSVPNIANPVRIGWDGNTPSVPPCAAGNANRYWPGLLDEVRIYNRALTAAEVKTLYQSGAAKILAPNNLGLVGYWSFNDATSTNTGYPNRAADFSGNGNTGVLTNGPTWSTGRLGKALNFDGSDDEVTIGDLVEPANITITAWVKPSVLETDRHIVSKWAPVAGQYILAIDDTSNNLFTFAVGDNSSLMDVCDSNITFSINTWFFVAGTYNGTTCRIYVNGVDATTLVLDGLSGNIPNSTLPLRIGVRGSDQAAQFNGLIDDVRIYNRALTAAEVLQLYNSR